MWIQITGDNAGNRRYRYQYAGYGFVQLGPDAPGLMPRLGMVVRQERHWMVIRVALALMPVAATTMPGILTSLPTRSLFKSLMEVPISLLCRVTWMSSTGSSPDLGRVI